MRQERRLQAASRSWRDGECFDMIGSMKINDAIVALGALASQPRLAVYRLLVKRGPDGYTPTELALRLAVPAPTLSFHLRGLEHARLVVSRRDGRNLHYRANLERVRGLVGFLTENCCSLAAEPCDANCRPLSAPRTERRRA